MSSLCAGFPGEVARVAELLGSYKALGAPGAFAAVMIDEVLDRAIEAQSEGDIVAMLRSYQELQECK